MTLDEIYKLANQVAFRADRIAPVREVADRVLGLAVDDAEVCAAASACKAAVAELESLAAALRDLLRLRRDQESARVEEQFRSTAEEAT